MTTETVPDPVIEAWSDRLEERLTEAGMEPAQAEAYRAAFELGLTRVISQTATRQELQDGLASLRQEMRDLEAALRAEIRQSSADLRTELQREIDNLRREMRFLFLFFGGIITALLSALIALVA